MKYNAQLSILIALNKDINKDYYALLNLDREHDIAWLHVESDKEGHAPEGKSSLIVQMCDRFSLEHY